MQLNIKLGNANVNTIVNTLNNLSVEVTLLKLSESNLGYKSVTELAQILAAVPPTVTVLDLSENDLYYLSSDDLAQVLTAIPATVTSLVLSGNDIVRRGDADLAQVFRGLPNTITSLDLSINDLGSNMSGEGLAHAFTAIPATISSLDLSNNDFYNLSSAELAQALAAIPSTVTSVNLGKNGLLRNLSLEQRDKLLLALVPSGKQGRFNFCDNVESSINKFIEPLRMIMQQQKNRIPIDAFNSILRELIPAPDSVITQLDKHGFFAKNENNVIDLSQVSVNDVDSIPPVLN